MHLVVEKTQIDIRVVLPDVPDAQDACVQRLGELLEAKEGIDAAHVMQADGERPDQLCIHFDPRRLSFGDVRELARRSGAKLDGRYGHLLLKTTPMHARKSRFLAERLHREQAGVLEAVASPDGLLRVEYDRETTDERAIRQRLHKMRVRLVEDQHELTEARQGGQPAGETPEESDHSHGGLFGANSELIFAILCGAMLSTGWLISVLTAAAPWVPWCFYLTAYGFGGFYTAREAVEKILAGQFEIDFLMLVAAIGAATLGQWAEGALLLFLFSLGHALEHYAMGRARRAIEALAELAPETALLRRNDGTEVVPVEQLRRGDIVIVKPNERVPADGIVIRGESSVNQAPITGESMPVDKRPVDDLQQALRQPEQLDASHRVFAGTINESGALEVQVTKLASESTLARVVEMVSEAETQQSPTQRFTDKFERYFVPAVLVLVFLLMFAWMIHDESFGQSFYRAMAVLVAASPCALAISTPSAVLSGVARAARGGVLVKGGGPLENLGRLGAIAFDKTGTLTEGKPQLTDVVCLDGVAEDKLLSLAVAVERLSDHPLAAAVVRGAEAWMKESRIEGSGTGNEEGDETDGVSRSGPTTQDSEFYQIPEATGLRSITGRGVQAMVDDQIIYIGKDDLFSEVDGPPLPDALHKKVESLEANGRTTMVLRHGERYLGVLGLMDTPRDSAKAMIAELRQLGIRRMIMISGDNQQVADAVARAVGVDEAWGDLMPDDKVDAIKKLRQQEEVAMVGDGVNDAPAMANATVGIAMGAAGSDVALETADVALMADDLNHLPFAVGLSRQTSRIIRQNLWFSLGMVAILVPATVLGLRMGVAVLFHEGSTLLVVFNALRLLAYRK